MPADSIREISIQGFKSIRSLTAELRPINIVIGANGSGKSNFLEAFSFLREVAARRLRNYVGAAGGAEKLLHFGSKTTEKINIHVSFNFPNRIAASSYDLTLAPTAGDGLFPEVVHFGPYPHSLSDWQSGGDAGIGNPDAEPELLVKGLRDELELWQRYHLHDTSYMYKTAAVRDNDFLRANGSNLPAFLYYLRNKWGGLLCPDRPRSPAGRTFFRRFHIKSRSE